MAPSPHLAQANAHARWSLIQAIWPPAVLTALATISATTPTVLGNGLHLLLLALAIAAGSGVLAYSVILAFDALLFRVLASYEDEWKGGAAVDDLLVRMHLKSTPTTTRSLADRAAGTRRLVTRQRIAMMAASAAIMLLMAPF